ncbi:hypothetical protein [Enterococcus mundtii]|uniref:hypothetical protein n=1 Tax=Enterococcus mundtii TaxID=53346 RepID=UPI001A97BA53|nr:hypothetical protein [Enterococcus mundtii]MBO1087144.1 hypothetical protein [Enterococcus mundtii]
MNNKNIDPKKLLQEEMQIKLEAFIESLRTADKINLVEYSIARDVLHDCTENHSTLSSENNIAQEFIEDEKNFIKMLNIGYQDMKDEYPDVDEWNYEEINEHSHEYKECVY